jgi:hypothetical protein
MSSQVLDAEWARHIGGNGNDQVSCMTTDNQGNVYVTGVYNSNPLKIYALTDNTTSVFDISKASTSQDTFIVKYDTSGNPLWGRHISGTSGGNTGNGITADNQGNVYVTGQYGANPLKIYASTSNDISGAIDVSNAGSTDAFIVKYDTSGTAQWARHIGGTGSESGNNIISDSQDNIYVVGGYTRDINVYNSVNNIDISFTILVTTTNFNDAFIVKYNPSGTPLWGRHIGGTNTDLASCVAVDTQNNLYVGGRYQSTTLTVYPNTNNSGSVFDLSNTNTNNSSDAFIVKYDTSGNPQWGRHIGGLLTDSIGTNGITTDSKNSVYVIGLYGSNPVKIYPLTSNAGITIDLSNTVGGNNAFIVKYDTSGNPQWGRHIGGSGNDGGNAIISDNDDNIYVSGTYRSNPLTIFPSTDNSGSVFDLSNSGSSDVYIVKYNSDGTPLIARHIGGFSPDTGVDIETDNYGNVYVCGNYQSNPLTIYPSTNNSGTTIDMSGTGASAIFIVKYRAFEPTPPNPIPIPQLPRTQIGYLTDNTLENKINIQNNNLMKTNYFSRTYNAKAMSYSDYLKIIQAQTQCNCPN